MTRTGVACIALVVLACLTARGQVRVRTVDGTIHEGRSLGLAGGDLRLGGGEKARAIPLRRVIDVDFGKVTVSAPTGSSGALRFELAHGDLLFGPVIDGDYDVVRVDSAVLGPVAVPIDSIRRVLVLANVGKSIAVDELVLPDGDDRDFLYVKAKETVDRVAGELEKFRRNSLLFAWNEQGASEFDFAKDGALALCLGSTEPPPPVEGLHVAVDFRDTGRLRGRLLAGEAGGLALEIAGGLKVALRPDKVLRISVRGGAYSA